MALIERLDNRHTADTPQRPHYDNVAYWSAHPREREAELERIARALARCGTPPQDIIGALVRVRGVMAGG